jgi:hypothetical protein
MQGKKNRRPRFKNKFIPKTLRKWLQNLHLDESVFLGAHTFPRAAVMVHTRLVVLGGEYCVALAELHLLTVLQVQELPANKLVKVRICIRS